jgi:hypothetical protein
MGFRRSKNYVVKNITTPEQIMYKQIAGPSQEVIVP